MIDSKELLRAMMLYYSEVQNDVLNSDNTLNWDPLEIVKLKGMREMTTFVGDYSKGNIL